MNIKPYESIGFSESKKQNGPGVVFLYEELKHKEKSLQEAGVDSLSVTKLMGAAKFTGKFGETLALPESDLFLVGLGKLGAFSPETLRKASAIAARVFRSKQTKYSIHMPYLAGAVSKKSGNAALAQAIVEGTLLALYKYEEFKKDEELAVKSVSLIGSGLVQGIARGRLFSLATLRIRELVNTPANIATPEYIARLAQESAKRNGLGIKVFGPAEMKKIGMDAILGVSQGSAEEPRFVVLDYKPANYNPKRHKTVALVGKGITFDSGGLSLKPAKYMEEMIGDKAGACVVLSVMAALRELKPDYRVYGVLALSENMPSGSAQRPGDIIRAYNGKSIEILNTDAEGRLVLADAMSYVSKELKPDYAIDLATLTGACVIALGSPASAVLGNDPRLVGALIESGNGVFERLWELPLWDEYLEMVKSEFADVRNSSYIGEAGTITGCAFISNFVEGVKWAHLDIASTFWSREPKFYTPARATGFGARLLLNLLDRKLVK